MRSSTVLVVAALAACSVDAERHGTNPGTRALEAEALPLPIQLTAEQAIGQVVYDSVCRGCHGVAGRGDGGAAAEGADSPPDLTADAYSRMTAGRLRDQFLAGMRSSHDADIRVFLTENGFEEVLSYVAVLSYPPGVPGSALNGREVYRRYCMSCHGTEGKGDGPAAVLLVTRPADFSHSTLVAKRDFGGLINRTRDGPLGAHASSMPAWGLFFDDRMLWDVATYLPTFQSSMANRPRD